MQNGYLNFHKTMKKTVLTKPGAGKETLLLPKGVPGREYFLQVIAARDAVVDRAIMFFEQNPSLNPPIVEDDDAITKRRQLDVAATAFQSAVIRPISNADSLANVALTPTVVEPVHSTPHPRLITQEQASAQPKPATVTNRDLSKALTADETTPEKTVDMLGEARSLVDAVFSRSTK